MAHCNYSASDTPLITLHPLEVDKWPTLAGQAQEEHKAGFFEQLPKLETDGEIEGSRECYWFCGIKDDPVG